MSVLFSVLATQMWQCPTYENNFDMTLILKNTLFMFLSFKMEYKLIFNQR